MCTRRTAGTIPTQGKDRHEICAPVVADLRHSALALLASATVGGAAAGEAPPAPAAPADVALVHGRIHTEDARRSIAQAMAVRGHTIVALGSDEAITALVGPGTRLIDLHGRTVLPGSSGSR